MNNQVSKSCLIGLLVLSAWNCKTTDPEPSPYEEGAYILNEGNFTDNNGTISFVARNGNGVATDIFSAANARPLRGLLQGYTEIDGKGLILADNTTAGQDKVEIVEIGTFKSRTAIGAPDVENPRHVIRVGPNRAYVSCWDITGDYSNGTFYKDPGYIAVVDLNTGAVTKKVPALKGVERMVATDAEVFVGSDPGYSPNTGAKTLLVLDVNTDVVKERIAFSAPPEPYGLDADGRLWIGVGNDLVRMNIANRTTDKITFSAKPNQVTFSGDKRTLFYMLNGKIYQLPTMATSAASQRQIISRTVSALGVDPVAGTVYATPSPILYKQAGYVLRYQSGGGLIDSVKAEIAPSRFFFR